MEINYFNDLIPDEIAIKTSLTNHQLLPTPKYELFELFVVKDNKIISIDQFLMLSQHSNKATGV